MTELRVSFRSNPYSEPHQYLTGNPRFRQKLPNRRQSTLSSTQSAPTILPTCRTKAQQQVTMITDQHLSNLRTQTVRLDRHLMGCRSAALLLRERVG